MNYQNLCINCMHEKKENHTVCSYCGFDSTRYESMPHVLVPFTILKGRYLLGKVLGAGGFGITYIAMDMALERIVAIKEYYVQGSMYRSNTISEMITLTNATESQERIYLINKEKFLQEAKTLATLDHLPGIVRVHDFFNENNTSYMVLEYLEGLTLKQYVRQCGGKLSIEVILSKLDPVLVSLQLLHQKQILHRDISPDNIMVMKDGSLKLFDFGGAKELVGNQERSMCILAKAGYSPIEQLQNNQAQGPWTDVYAMAATIYYCICGIKPVDSTERVAGNDPLRRPCDQGIRISKNQETALLRGLAVNPRNRFQSMEAFRRALAGEGSKSLSESASNLHIQQDPILDSNNKTKWVVLGAVGVVILAAAGIIFGILWNGKQKKTKTEETKQSETTDMVETVKTETEEKEVSLFKTPETDSTEWAQAYLDYLQTDTGRDNWAGYELIYLDQDDIPEMMLIGIAHASGSFVVYYADGTVQEQHLGSTSSQYIERGNLLYNMNGEMGLVSDTVYSIRNHKMTVVASGEYGNISTYPAETDSQGNKIYEYQWEGQDVSEEEYNSSFSAVYDLNSKDNRNTQDETLYSYSEIQEYLSNNYLNGKGIEKSDSSKNDSGNYIIADSDSKYLSYSDVQNLSLQEINYAKNEIYARKGRKFKSRELQNYFDSQSWYHGTVSADRFDSSYANSVFNVYEKANTKFLDEVEHSKSSNGYQLDQ